MKLSNVVSVVLVAIFAFAACGGDTENKERSAACTDRTNGVSCGACCETKSSSFTEGKCVCKGEVVQKAPK
jgi:hypothetical protein